MSAKRMLFLLPLFALASVGPLPADEKKTEKKDTARVTVALPLGVAPAATTKVVIRGLKLDAATEVRFTDASVTAKILNKGKASVPDKQEPAKLGDTQVELEVTVPVGVSGDRLPFLIVTPAGETAEHALLLETSLSVIPEKEPNNGFRQAQPIQLPQVVEGVIAQPQDVDVFRFEGKAGQQIVCEVLAARHGSSLDSVLTLYDAQARQLARNDDFDGSSDSRLEFTLPRDGTYYLSLLDAHDTGGVTHVYRLVTRLK
jgi:hypothetical protein